jgi:hypothetical protein
LEDEKSRWFNIYACSIVDCILQDSLINRFALHECQERPIHDLLLYFLREIGPNRKGLLPYVMMKMYEPMRHDALIRRAYFDVMPEILTFGVAKMVPEERLADAMHE